MHRGVYSVAAAAVAAVCVAVAAGAATSAARTQPDAQFAASFVSSGTTAVDATTQKVSCYRPEVAYFDGLPADQGYPNGGGTVCPGATTGESLGPYPTQDAVGAANPPMLVKDHSESDIRVDPTNSSHLIGHEQVVRQRGGIQPSGRLLRVLRRRRDLADAGPRARATRAGPTTPIRSARSIATATSTR